MNEMYNCQCKDCTDQRINDAKAFKSLVSKLNNLELDKAILNKKYLRLYDRFKALRKSFEDLQPALGNFKPMQTAPYDEYLLLCVPSGYKYPVTDFVQCIRHSKGYKNGAWVTAQNEYLTDSHTELPHAWMPLYRDAIPKQSLKK